MRGRIASSVIGLALFAATAASAAPNIAGEWHVVGHINCGRGFVSLQPDCNIRQSGGRLSGVCVGPNATGPLSGAVVGSHVAWTWRTEATTNVGVNGAIGFNGTYVDSHLVRGTVQASGVVCSGPTTMSR